MSQAIVSALVVSSAASSTQLVFAARDQRDAVTAAGQLAGDIGADARGGTGHDGGGGR